MASVIFLKAVNVGGHQTFKPGILAKQLAEFDVVNVGAAGTMVVRGKIGVTQLREEILRRLPFKPELMICPGREILALAADARFRDGPYGKDLRQFVSVMAKTPAHEPALPLERPAGGKWEVRLFAVTGRFAVSLWRRQERGVLYPNSVVEKHFGMPATTRGWNTILAVRDLLEK